MGSVGDGDPGIDGNLAGTWPRNSPAISATSPPR